MKKFLSRLAPLLVLSLILAGVGQAGSITGSMVVSFTNVAANPDAQAFGDILTTNKIGIFCSQSPNCSTNNGLFTSSGDFHTFGNSASITSDLLLDLTNGPISANSFSFADSTGSWGTFTASSLMVDQLGANSRTVKLNGYMTPGTYSGWTTGGITGDSASLTMAFTQNGGPGTSISLSATLSAPSEFTVPEPASMALMGSALVALGLIRRRSLVK